MKRKLLILFLIFLVLFPPYPMRAANNGIKPIIVPEEEATIAAIKKIAPAVVSIIIYDEAETQVLNLSSGEATTTKQRSEKGSGTGFLINSNGLIITNKHVINAGSDKASYRIILNSGKEYYANLVGKDPINDLAIIKVGDKNLPFVSLGDSDKLQVGSSVIAIGNALGQYQNSATKGIVSGLGRSIQAADQANATIESLDNVIQTDADINPGNSGGPLVNLRGEVVGINTATDQSGRAIGFAIPINDAKQVINSVKASGRIIRPRIGLRYLMITPEIAKDKNLTSETGALVVSEGDGAAAVVVNSPAEKAGIIEGDIILEINGIKILNNNTLLTVVQKFKPGNKIGVRIKRGEKIVIKQVILDEFK